MTKALWAPVKWAQRKDSIYVTVDLPDVKDEKVKLTNTNLTFSYVSKHRIHAGFFVLYFVFCILCMDGWMCVCGALTDCADAYTYSSGTSNGQSYEVTLDFFKEVDVDAKESIWAKAARNVHFHIVKKDQDAEFWPRLLSDKHLEKTNVSVDWSKYVDEDEEEEQGGFDMSALNGGGGFDINQMMAAQNAGLMGGEESDSDDENLPDLDP